VSNVQNVVGQLHDRSSRKGRSIGAILIDAGRLKSEDAEQILRLQQQEDIRFGDAAIQLGILSENDIQFALARQFEYPYLQHGSSRVSHEVIAAYEPFTPQVEALRALRSQLVLRWLDTDTQQKVLSIVSPERSEGRSWLAANLAVVFSQLGERTLLIDADLRGSTQHQLFGLENKQGLTEILSARASFTEVIQRVPALLDLSVITAGATPPNPQEMLARTEMEQLLKLARANFDVIIMDTPAASECADGQVIATRAGSALLIAQNHASHIASLQRNLSMLNEAGVNVVGSVLIER
jgi:protein-tyrosine kinase